MKLVLNSLLISFFMLLTNCRDKHPKSDKAIDAKINDTQKHSIVPPSYFIETKIPKRSSAEWYKLNYAINEFCVNNNKGNLEIDEAKESYKISYEIPEGTLIGIDHGEFGGELRFISKSQPSINYVIMRGNIKFIFGLNNKTYFIDGLSHLGLSHGIIYELQFVDNMFVYNKIMELNDSPEAMCIYNNNIYIAASESFYVIKNWSKQIIYSKTFWEGLYPNSIAIIDERNIFIGIRSGIVKLDLPDRTMQFYKYDKIESN